MIRKLAFILLTGLAMFTLISGGCARLPAGESKTTSLLMVIAPNDFREDTTIGPKEILEQKGITVILSSTTLDEATGVGGSKLKPQIKISEAEVKNYDAIVLAGGRGVKEYLWGDQELISLVKEAYQNNMLVAAICFSPVILAQAGILKDKQATVFDDADSISELENNGAIYVNDSLVISGNIITARDPASAEEFATAIWQALAGNSGQE
jgi:protease I